MTTGAGSDPGAGLSPERVDVLTMGTCLVELTPGDGGVSFAAAPTLTKLASGAAALFACALSRMQTSVSFLSAVGDDEPGEFIIAELTRMGVGVAHIVRVREQLTSLSLASADGRGGKTFFFYRFSGYSDPLETLRSADIPDSALQSARLFDFTESCLRAGGGLRQSVMDLARRSRALGLEVCYAPNWRPILWKCSVDEAREVQRAAVRVSDIVIMNAEEAQVISGERTLQDAIESLSHLGPHSVVVTQGGDRPAIVRGRGIVSEVPVYPVEVRYDVGAGDTFHAGFVSEHLRGASAADAARFAAAAAAVKITRPPGLDTLPLRGEVESLVRGA